MINDHLFNKNGLIYICGGSNMAADVKKLIVDSLK